MFINRTGELTFSAPADWSVNSCEDQTGAYVVAEHGNLSPVCGRGEYNQAWLFAVSLDGDQRGALPPNASNYSYTAPPNGKAVAVADGDQGYRYTAHVDQDLGLPPPKGTDQVYYVFFNGSRTYALWYDHWPTDPDRTADFDKLVQQTLRFSA